MLNKIAQSVIQKVEESNHPFYYYVFVFGFSIFVRNFLEIFAYQEVKLTDWYAHLHYSSYYVALVGWLIILLGIFIKKPIAQISKVVLTFMPIIIICPVIDIVVHFWAPFHQTLGYLSPELHGAFFEHYFTFFGNHIGEKMGPSIGYRVEVLFVLIGFGIYLFTQTNNLLKTVAGFIALYTLIYFFCSTPYVLKNFFHFKPYSPQVVPYYMVLAVIALVTLYAKAFKTEFFQLVKDFRWLRLLFYIFILLFGAVYGLKLGGFVTLPKLSQFVFIVISLVFAWKYAVMINNIEDLEIDKVSNTNRPLLNNFSASHYKTVAWFVLGISMIFAFYVNVAVGQFMAIFTFNYFIYSSGPIRLKQVPVISKFPIAANVTLLFMLGNVLVDYSVSKIPAEIYIYMLVGGTLALNVIDIKDYEGDKAAGVKTLPVLLGLKPSKFILGIVFLVGYFFSFLFTVNNTTYLMLLGLGVLQLISITAKNYSDKRVVGIFLLSILLVIVERFL